MSDRSAPLKNDCSTNDIYYICNFRIVNMYVFLSDLNMNKFCERV